MFQQKVSFNGRHKETQEQQSPKGKETEIQEKRKRQQLDQELNVISEGKAVLLANRRQARDR